MMPWDMDRLTRFEVFEIYLKPDKDKMANSSPLRSHRERLFDHWKLNGFARTWEECERLWQLQQSQRLSQERRQALK